MSGPKSMDKLPSKAFFLLKKEAAINIASEQENSCCTWPVRFPPSENHSRQLFASPAIIFHPLYKSLDLLKKRGKVQAWGLAERKQSAGPPWLQPLAPAPRRATLADDGDLKPLQQHISWKRRRSITLPAISSPAIFPPAATSFVLHSRFSEVRQSFAFFCLLSASKLGLC